MSLSFIYQKVKAFERQEYPSNVFPGLLEPAYFKNIFRLRGNRSLQSMKQNNTAAV